MSGGGGDHHGPNWIGIATAVGFAAFGIGVAFHGWPGGQYGNGLYGPAKVILNQENLQDRLPNGASWWNDPPPPGIQTPKSGCRLYTIREGIKLNFYQRC